MRLSDITSSLTGSDNARVNPTMQWSLFAKGAISDLLSQQIGLEAFYIALGHLNPIGNYIIIIIIIILNYIRIKHIVQNIISSCRLINWLCQTISTHEVGNKV